MAGPITMKLSIEQTFALKHREAHDCSLISMPNMGFWNSKKKSPEELAHIIDRAQTLQAGINMPYADKVKHAKKVISAALKQHQHWAISYSGGRDSTVLSHLMVEGMGILNIPHVMSNTRMEYPETIKMVTAWYARMRELGVECNVVFPDVRPHTLWKQIGVPVWSKEIAYKYRKFAASPTDNVPVHVPDDLVAEFRRAKAAGIKITEKCCDVLKKKPLKKFNQKLGIKGNFTGVRCSESRARRLAWITKGALYQAVTHGNQWIANPLAFWTEQDVATYLKVHQIDVLRPDTLSGGSGCVVCMFGCRSRAQEGTPNALQDLKTRNPRMWTAALDDWGYRDVLEFLNIPYQ